MSDVKSVTCHVSSVFSFLRLLIGTIAAFFVAWLAVMSDVKCGTCLKCVFFLEAFDWDNCSFLFLSVV